jgi:site-specific DNA-methyltransferase (adenine-specific)
VDGYTFGANHRTSPISAKGVPVTPYYERGGIVIYHADCFDVLHGLSGIGAVVTDPPYSSGGAFRGDRMGSTLKKYVSSDSEQQATGIAFSGDNRDQRSFMAWCSLWLWAARAASVQGATVACFIDWRQLPTMTDALQAGGWVWRGVGSWSKKFGRPRAGGFSGACEFLAWGTNGPLIEHPAYPCGVYECGTPNPVSRDHITQKPEPVMAWAMGNVAPGSLVLDPFMGSGTTLVVAKSRGMSAIGIEIEERYCEIAAKRLEQDILPLEASA